MLSSVSMAGTMMETAAMRSEQEMMALVRAVAEEDPRIRAAYLEGSRATDYETRDHLQDYDVEFVVTDTAPFIADQSWIDRFGPRLLMQRPDEFADADADPANWYGWLILFTDGNRLDLHVASVAYALSHLETWRTLVDKDGIMPAPVMTSDQRWWVSRPGQRDFDECCNEFCWCLNNVGKGLWRGQLLYAMDQLDAVVRPQLLRLLSWRAGADHGFEISIGKAGKYLDRWLSEELFRRYLATYAPAEPAAVWRAVETMVELFDEAARGLAEDLDLIYDAGQTAAITWYLGLQLSCSS